MSRPCLLASHVISIDISDHLPVVSGFHNDCSAKSNMLPCVKFVRMFTDSAMTKFRFCLGQSTGSRYVLTNILRQPMQNLQVSYRLAFVNVIRCRLLKENMCRLLHG